MNRHTSAVVHAMYTQDQRLHGDRAQVADYLRDYFLNDEEGWASEHTPGVDVEQVDWPLVAALVN